MKTKKIKNIKSRQSDPRRPPADEELLK